MQHKKMLADVLYGYTQKQLIVLVYSIISIYWLLLLLAVKLL